MALSPNNDKILILATKGSFNKSDWVLASLLKQHQELVLTLSWHWASNKIASGGIDHNVYIWTE